MPSDNLQLYRTSIERKFQVGWQKLTEQEFVQALTVALLEKVDDHRRNHHRLSAFRESLQAARFLELPD